MPFVAFLALAIVFYVVVKLWWLILAVAVVSIAVRLVRRWWAAEAARARARVRRDAELACRARRQNAQVLAGDPRGVYGRFWDGPNSLRTLAGPLMTEQTGSVGGP